MTARRRNPAPNAPGNVDVTCAWRFSEHTRRALAHHIGIKVGFATRADFERIVDTMVDNWVAEIDNEFSAELQRREERGGA